MIFIAVDQWCHWGWVTLHMCVNMHHTPLGDNCVENFVMLMLVNEYNKLHASRRNLDLLCSLVEIQEQDFKSIPFSSRKTRVSHRWCYVMFISFGQLFPMSLSHIIRNLPFQKWCTISKEWNAKCHSWVSQLTRLQYG